MSLVVVDYTPLLVAGTDVVGSSNPWKVASGLALAAFVIYMLFKFLTTRGDEASTTLKTLTAIVNNMNQGVTQSAISVGNIEQCSSNTNGIVKSLYEMHNVKTNEGIPVWYNNSHGVEQAIVSNTSAINKLIRRLDERDTDAIVATLVAQSQKSSEILVTKMLDGLKTILTEAPTTTDHTIVRDSYHE